ncbi:mCG1027971, isoform CRA_a, partial [Mus musculus]
KKLLAYGTKRKRNKNALPPVLVKGRPDSPPLSMLAGTAAALGDFFFLLELQFYLQQGLGQPELLNTFHSANISS